MRYKREADAVIRHPALGEIVGADALAAVAGAHLQAAAVGVFAVGLLALQIV